MQWIDGIDRVAGRLMPTLLTSESARTSVEPRALGQVRLSDGPNERRKIRVAFRAFQPASTRAYVSRMCPELLATERHRLFAVEYDGTWFLMPALVLLQALFRPLHLLADYLLRPQGLEQVCIPCADNCHDVEWSLLGLRNRQGSLSTLRQPMAWMWSFPSARKMWESVYECGQEGALGLVLPEGEIELVVRGALRGDTLCVTDACFTRVITEEKPYPFASGHTGKITFHENVAFTGRHTAPTPTLDETIRTVHGSWSVTDAEWTRIEPILVGNPIKKKPRLHDLRDLLDGVLVKLGSGIPWQKVEYKVGTWNNAAGAYQQWVKDGRWQRVRATLVKSRGS